MTKYKRSNHIFSVRSIALSLENIGSRLLEFPVQCLVGVPVPSSALRESVSVLLTCFSQLGERDTILLLFIWYKTYRCSLLASTSKSNTADFAKR